MRSLPPIPCNADGALPYGTLQALGDAMTGVRRVLLATHGWLTDFESAESWFSRLFCGLGPLFQDDTLAIPLHWPSNVDDAGGIVDLLGEFTYWQMEKRARRIGQTAGFDLVRTAISEANQPIEVHCIGHSFGGLVATHTLAALATAQPIFAGDTFALTIIQGALPDDYLESGQPGGPVQRLFPRIRATRSDWDVDLRCGFPLVEGLELKRKPAMGCVGLPQATLDVFGDRAAVLDLSRWHAGHSDWPLNVVCGFIASTDGTNEPASMRRAA